MTTADIGHNRPPKRGPRLLCPECGCVFVAQHHRALFCSPAHSKAYSNRQLSEGQRIVALAKAWRMSRGAKDADKKEAGKEAFFMLCRELDALNAADKQAGRLPAWKVFLSRLRCGMLDHGGVLSR